MNSESCLSALAFCSRSSGGIVTSFEKCYWSSCVDGILEYSRVVFELQPIGAGISVHVHNSKGPKALSSWDQKEQSLTCISRAFESLQQSDTDIASVDSAIPYAVESVLSEIPMKTRTGSELRLIFLIYPNSCGVQEEDIEAEDRRLSEIFENHMKAFPGPRIFLTYA